MIAIIIGAALVYPIVWLILHGLETSMRAYNQRKKK